MSRVFTCQPGPSPTRHLLQIRTVEQLKLCPADFDEAFRSKTGKHLAHHYWRRPYPGAHLFQGQLTSEMGNHNVLKVNRFSMFSPAPLISTLLVVLLCLPSTQKLIKGKGTE